LRTGELAATSFVEAVIWRQSYTLAASEWAGL